jgi:YARHG domain
MHSMTTRAIALSAAFLAFSSAAYADCYDVFGCTERNRFNFEQLANGPNCEFLYTMRNRIYQQHGYCFKTARAIATLGNENCRFRDMNQVPLSAIETGNAATILQVEHAKGCPE